MPPNTAPTPDEPTPQQARIIRASFRAEDQAVVRLLKLLEEAAEDLEGRVGVQGLAAEEMLGAVRQATDRVRIGLTFGLDDASAEAIAQGVRLAETALPRAAVPFGISDELLRALTSYQATLITGLTDDLRHGLTGVIQLGLIAGQSNEEIGRRLIAEGLEAGPWRSAEVRAEVVVRTELNRVANSASYARYQAAAEEVPGLMKRWISTADTRTRPDHVALSGVTIPMDEDFSVGGFAGAFPHDSRLPPSQSVRCRCRLLTKLPED